LRQEKVPIAFPETGRENGSSARNENMAKTVMEKGIPQKARLL
jgi:hypothetical protein